MLIDASRGECPRSSDVAGTAAISVMVLIVPWALSEGAPQEGFRIDISSDISIGTVVADGLGTVAEGVDSLGEACPGPSGDTEPCSWCRLVRRVELEEG
jgi:hypothetical protein